MVPFNSWISQRCELNTVKTRKKDRTYLRSTLQALGKLLKAL